MSPALSRGIHANGCHTLMDITGQSRDRLGCQPGGRMGDGGGMVKVGYGARHYGEKVGTRDPGPGLQGLVG